MASLSTVLSSTTRITFGGYAPESVCKLGAT
jgi:hypothetical protein